MKVDHRGIFVISRFFVHHKKCSDYVNVQTQERTVGWSYFRTQKDIPWRSNFPNFTISTMEWIKIDWQRLNFVSGCFLLVTQLSLSNNLLKIWTVLVLVPKKLMLLAILKVITQLTTIFWNATRSHLAISIDRNHKGYLTNSISKQFY